MKDMKEYRRRFVNEWGEKPKDDLSRCINILEDMAISYNKSIKESVFENHAKELLSRLTLKEVYEACKKAKLSEDYWPSVAKLLKYAPKRSLTEVDTVDCSRCGGTGALYGKEVNKLFNTMVEVAYKCPCENGQVKMSGLNNRAESYRQGPTTDK